MRALIRHPTRHSRNRRNRTDAQNAEAILCHAKARKPRRLILCLSSRSSRLRVTQWSGAGDRWIIWNQKIGLRNPRGSRRLLRIAVRRARRNQAILRAFRVEIRLGHQDKNVGLGSGIAPRRAQSGEGSGSISSRHVRILIDCSAERAAMTDQTSGRKIEGRKIFGEERVGTLLGN